jgi:hypothetical protein
MANIYLEDQATAHTSGMNQILDISTTKFTVVGELQINFPIGLGKWEISFNGVNGPFEEIDPAMTPYLNILKPEDFEIIVQRVGWTYSIPTKNLTDVSNSTTFRLAYMAESGKHLYSAVDIGAWNNATQKVDYYSQRILKLAGNGDTMDPSQLLASYWQAGTRLLITSDPLLDVPGTHHRYASGVTDDTLATSITFTKATTSYADYDLTLNEANFYKFFVMGKNDINGNAQVAVYLKYWDGAQWVLSKETPSKSPILLTWSQKDDTITQQNFQVKLNSSSRWYTFEMQWRTGNVQITKFSVMPVPNLDNEPQGDPMISMGNGATSRSRDGDGDNTVGPMEGRPVNATYRSKLIPDWLMTGMYEKLKLPLIGQTIPFQGPQFNTTFGKYVAFDLNWFVEIDQLGEKSAWVSMTLHGEIELKGSGIKFTYSLEAKVDWSRDRNGTVWDQMNWSITFTIGMEVPIGRMIWGFPIDYTIKDKNLGVLFRLQFDIYWAINIQLQLTGDFKASQHIMWFVRFYTQIYAKFNMDLVLDLNKIVNGLSTSQEQFEAQTNQLEEEKDRAKADFDKQVEIRTKWVKDNHDK